MERKRESLLLLLSSLEVVREIGSLGAVERRASRGRDGGFVGEVVVVVVVMMEGISERLPTLDEGDMGVSSSKEGRWTIPVAGG